MQNAPGHDDGTDQVANGISQISLDDGAQASLAQDEASAAGQADSAEAKQQRPNTRRRRGG